MNGIFLGVIIEIIGFPSDIHVSQPELGNDFTVHNVRAEDFPEWTDGIWNKDITEPQFSFRMGHFLIKEDSWD